jgi:hypothetical protein
MSLPKRGGGIDLSALNVSKTPRSAREVAEKKMRAELRGDTGSKKTGAERDEELAEFYRKKNAEKTEVARVAKQKLLLANPTQRSQSRGEQAQPRREQPSHLCRSLTLCV